MEGLTPFGKGLALCVVRFWAQVDLSRGTIAEDGRKEDEMIKQLIRLSFACVVAASLCGVAAAHQRYEQGPQGANAYGFRNGYLDGFQHGSEDRGAQVDFNMESRDYDSAMRGYDPSMGSDELYRDSYRQGYAAGYNDGYYGRESRFQGRNSGPPYPGGPFFPGVQEGNAPTSNTVAGRGRRVRRHRRVRARAPLWDRTLPGRH